MKIIVMLQELNMCLMIRRECKSTFSSIVIKNNYPNFNYIITTNKNHNPNYIDEAVRKLNEFQNTISKLPSALAVPFIFKL